MDMPNNGISFNCIPRPKTWHGCVEQHRTAAAFRIPAGESIGHHSTNIVPDDVNVFQVQVFHQLMNVFRHICSVITACRCRRTAYAAQINCHHRKLLRQQRHDTVIRVPVFREAVQQNDSGTSASANIVEGCSVRLRSDGEEPASQRRQPWIDLLP
jgi:hypothetical protein